LPDIANGNSHIPHLRMDRKENYGVSLGNGAI